MNLADPTGMDSAEQERAERQHEKPRQGMTLGDSAQLAQSAVNEVANRSSVTLSMQAAWGLGVGEDIAVDRQTFEDGTLEVRPSIDVAYGARAAVTYDFKAASSDEPLSGPLAMNITTFLGGGPAGGFNFAMDYSNNWDLTLSGGYGWGGYYGSISPISTVERVNTVPDISFLNQLTLNPQKIAERWFPIK